MKLKEIIDSVDKLKIEIDALRPIDPEQEKRIMQKFRLDWNYHSNAIEGNTLSLGETRAFLLHGITAKGKPFKDYLDIKGHNEAIVYLEEYIRGQRLLTEAHIREIHKILLVEPYEVDAITPDGKLTKKRIAIGQYKTTPNHVQTSTGETHYYASPEETPAKMGDLMKWYREEKQKGDLHPLLLAATFHYRFASIHPFDDGNGRMARLLMNLMLMQAGYVPTIIKISSREDYLLALEKADAGDLDDFISLIGEELIDSLELYLRGAKGESIEELDDLDKKVTLLQKKLESEEAITPTEKDFATQKRLFDDLISPLLMKLFAQFAKFEVFFEKSQWRLAYIKDNEDKSLRSADELNIVLHKLRDFVKSDVSIDQIRGQYELIGFVKNENYNFLINTNFNMKRYGFDVRYVVRAGGGSASKHELTSGNYDRIYTEEEIEELAFSIANQVYNMIEQQANS